MRPLPTATNTSWPIQSAGPDIIASPIADVLAVSYTRTRPPLRPPSAVTLVTSGHSMRYPLFHGVSRTRRDAPDAVEVLLHIGSMPSPVAIAPVLGPAKRVTRWRCMGYPLFHEVAKTRASRARCCRSPHYRGQNIPLPTPAQVLRGAAKRRQACYKLGGRFRTDPKKEEQAPP